MSMIQVTNLNFTYEGSPAPVFENVSFRIDTDWKLGFTGRNGRGKTTFLKLLMGEYEYRGSIQSDAVFDYFPFEVENPEMDTILVAGEVCPDYEYWQLVKELSRLQVEDEVLFRPFRTLSNGEQTKVLLALLFLKEQHFLLIDEPTNHLDMEAREVVAEYLSRKKGFILVSHDRAFLDRAVDHMLVINKTDIQVQKGNFSSWYENKQRQDSFEMEENERLKKDIRRLQSAAAQSKQWADDVEGTKLGKRNAEACAKGKFIGSRAYIGEKSRRMQQRRKNLERRQDKAIEEKSGLLHNVDTAEDLKLFPERWHQERLAVLKDAAISYGEKMVLEGVNLEIKRGQRLVLKGRNGCGKSSILKVLLQMNGMAEERQSGSTGEMHHESTGKMRHERTVVKAGNCGVLHCEGETYMGNGLRISYVSQDTSNLSGNLRDYAVSCGVEE
ncbi:MAG: ATP-binding cassette domain-containing protein, partial [Lachnospiraceae bacterium]|nr:ATP-binding cassette domain-containing protein [Lachnospiraceae bacterium]